MDWNDIADRFQSGALLIGNGASIAIHSGFDYRSLSDLAKQNHLTAEEAALFDKFTTPNFELILRNLWITGTTTKIFDLPTIQFNAAYLAIQKALGEAVREVHLEHDRMHANAKEHLARTYATYDFVFSTNYDLTLYWAMMHGLELPKSALAFKDYFWAESFDPLDVRIRGKCTKVLWLHGGLHLYLAQDGRTLKPSLNYQHGNLLSEFPKAAGAGAVPLFITEGNSSDKQSAIRRSEYLTFAFKTFSDCTLPLTVFGQALNEEFDGHILKAIFLDKGRRKIAFGIRKGSKSDATIIAAKARLKEAAPSIDWHFFRSETHPLANIPAPEVEEVDVAEVAAEASVADVFPNE